MVQLFYQLIKVMKFNFVRKIFYFYENIILKNVKMTEVERLIRKLISGEGKLSLLLLEAQMLATKLNDDTLLEFIEKETNGYPSNELPDYRKIQAQIIGTIQDAYGQIIYKNKPLDFSILSDHIGFDISKVLIPDSIGFIEDGLQQLTGHMAERPIHSQIVRMLNETFKHNNPHLNLISASHEFGTAAVQFILTKVRQDLIIKLQKINHSDITISELNEITDENYKTVFVSYAWTNNEHDKRIISFVDFLRKRGYDASMDRKKTQEETSINLNKMMVQGIQDSDKVIVVLNSKYKEKADSFEGGVGMEIGMILEEIKSNPNKFIFVSFGENKISEITPKSIKGREILDLKKDQDDHDFNGLFSKLENKNIIQFSDVGKTTPSVKAIVIKPFKL